MIIDGILKKEKKRNEHMRTVYLREIEVLPKGSLFVKEQGGKTYCYLRYRKGGKVVSEYAGSGDLAAKLKIDINRRRHLEKMLKALESEHGRISKMERVK